MTVYCSKKSEPYFRSMDIIYIALEEVDRLDLDAASGALSGC